MLKTEGLVKNNIRIYETYNNTVMPHGHHIFSKSSDTAKSTMCAYPQSDHALPHWKCVLQCCADCRCINIPDQGTDNQNSDTTPSIGFHIYQIIASCTSRGIMV